MCSFLVYFIVLMSSGYMKMLASGLKRLGMFLFLSCLRGKNRLVFGFAQQRVPQQMSRARIVVMEAKHTRPVG